MGKEQENKSPLNEFLNSLEDFPGLVVDNLLRTTKDEDEKSIILSFAPSLKNQIKELSGFIKEQSQNISKQQNLEIDQLLKMTSGTTLIKDSKSLIPSIGSVVGKIGISKITKEIKKIIRLILDTIGIKLPKWIEGLFNLIDEILDAILSVGSPKLSDTLSRMETNYLTELTQLVKLQKASEFKYAEEDEEE